MQRREYSTEDKCYAQIAEVGWVNFGALLFSPTDGLDIGLYFVRLVVEMPPNLQQVLNVLNAHEAELRRRGVCHAAVFGSVARGEAGSHSDIDVLVDLDPQSPSGCSNMLASSSTLLNCWVVRRTSSTARRSNLCSERRSSAIP